MVSCHVNICTWKTFNEKEDKNCCHKSLHQKTKPKILKYEMKRDSIAKVENNNNQNGSKNLWLNQIRCKGLDGK